MRVLAVLAFLTFSGPALAESIIVEPVTVSQWKSVFGRVEARDVAVARARIGGTLVELTVTEGDAVTAGQQIGLIHDDKIAFQIDAVDGNLAALSAQFKRASSEYDRGQSLFERGTITRQALDQLTTELKVTSDQITAAEAERKVLEQTLREGAILAPADGVVISVPVTRDSVVMPGEAVANIASNGFYLRISLPERHANNLKIGTTIPIITNGEERTGTLSKIYPDIVDGRVTADVDVAGLDTAFVGARELVQVPLGTREILLVPAAAVEKRSGIDFVTVATDAGSSDRSVVLGAHFDRDGTDMVEVLTGLEAGDEVIIK